MSRKKRRVSRAGRGALTTIACLMIGSALVRVTAGAGEAWAKAEEHFLQPPETQAHVAPMAHTPQTGSDCTTEEGLQTMLVALEDREKRLNHREDQIKERADALAIADREVTARMRELQMIEQDLSRTLAIADQAAERDIGKLVSVYENMKSKDAAALFEEMDPNFAAGFLARMQPEAAAGVMAGLSPATAYTISVVLAGRNAEAPKE